MKWTARRIHHRNVRSCQRGITLIELLIALAIITAIGAAAVIATHELLTTSSQANDEQLAVSQLRAAEHWMTRDTLTSQSITPDSIDPSGFPLVLSWQSFDGTEHTVTYTLLDSHPAPLKELQRQEVTASGTNTLRVADYIDATQTSCSFSGSTLTVTLAATASNYTTTRTFEAKPRSDAPPT